MLGKNLKCESCSKEHCSQICWNKILRNWLCYECSEKYEKEVKRLEKLSKK